MNRFCIVILVCYACFLVFVFVDLSEADESKKLDRYRRYLSFQNFSKFFIRLNTKSNMVPWNQIFAQAVGFRMNWDDPPDSFHPYHHLSRRAVYNSIEVILDRNGLSGFHCVRRAICEMDEISEPKGIYLKILKMFVRKHSSETDKWHKYTDEDCHLSIQRCPFSMLEILPYTDL